MISIKNISKSFDGNLIFKGVNLEIEKGDSIVIIGGSGCGKSTLLRCINNLITPEEGEIYFDGVNLLDKSTDINEIRRRMGMVYQQFNLFSHLNVLENVILAPMKVLGVSREDAIKEAVELLKKVGMEDRKFFMPDELSGGQKQRVAIARTLAMHPDVILFDEPTSALDPTMVDEVENVIRSLVDSGMTSVIVTHEMNFARKIASKVVFLAEKTAYEVGTADEIFNHPQKPLTRQFLYRSRMYETHIKPGDFDAYETAAQLKQFVMRYDYDTKQLDYMNVLMDELIYPFIKAKYPASSVELRLICSESSADHMINISVHDIDPEKNGERYIDEISEKILSAKSKNIVVVQKDGGAEISINI